MSRIFTVSLDNHYLTALISQNILKFKKLVISKKSSNNFTIPFHVVSKYKKKEKLFVLVGYGNSEFNEDLNEKEKHLSK